MKNFRLVKADEIDCRVAMVKKNGVSLLLYKDARCDMNILDETVGAFNWQKAYSRDNANCTVSLWDEAKQQWISKEDTGTESNTEKEKGLASDSFKRACFNWGIGRELYTAPFIWIKAEKCNITEYNGKFTCKDTFTVKDIAYDASERICYLLITNNQGETVYSFGKKPEKLPHETLVRLQASILNHPKYTPEYVCNYYKVKDLSELSVKQAEDVISVATK